MIFNGKDNPRKIKASLQQELQVLAQSLDSNLIVTKNNHKDNLFPSCETSESLSFVRKREENDEKLSKRSILEGILKFDQSLLFQHATQLYESKASLSIQQNGQNMMNNCDFSFNAQFSSTFHQQKLNSSKQVKKYGSFLLLRMEQIQKNNVNLQRELIQIKKELIRFHHQKHFIFEDIKTKISKKVSLCLSQLTSENRKLKKLIQSGLQDQKRSKQKQSYLSHQYQQLNQRLILLNENISEKEKQIQLLKLQNQTLIRQNEQLFFKTSISQPEVDYSKENQLFINKLTLFQRQENLSKNLIPISINEHQQLNIFRNILCNLMDSSNMNNQIRFSIQQISIQICKMLLYNSNQQELHDKISIKTQNNTQNNDFLKQVPFKIQYSLLIIFALQFWNSNKMLIKSIFGTEYMKDFFNPQALSKQLMSIWVQKQLNMKTKIMDRVENSMRFICSPSSPSVKVPNSPSSSMGDIQEFDLGGDSLV